VTKSQPEDCLNSIRHYRQLIHTHRAIIIVASVVKRPILFSLREFFFKKKSEQLTPTRGRGFTLVLPEIAK
jgi:hypothetical protein